MISKDQIRKDLLEDGISAKICYATSKANGFYDKGRDNLTPDRLATNLALITSEVSECLEALRNTELFEFSTPTESIEHRVRADLLIISDIEDIIKKDQNVGISVTDTLKNPIVDEKIRAIKDGILWELGDVVIRVLDTVGWLQAKATKEDYGEEHGFDVLVALIALRNTTRSKKHGKIM